MQRGPMRRHVRCRVRWWVPGDWNGFFGLFTNVVLNVIVLTGLCLGVVKLPDDIVFGRILPALGHRAADRQSVLRLARLPVWPRREGRSDVTAMPYGPSVPHMFIVVFVIMLPIYLKTNDALLAWQAGLAWAFIIGIIVLIGAFVGPTIRRLHAARGDARHAGRHLDRLHLDAAGLPDVGGAVDRLRLARHRADRPGPPTCGCLAACPAGSRRCIVGTVIAWIAAVLGWTDVVNAPQVAGVASHSSASTCRCRAPTCSPGLANIAPLLVTAIPLGIYNFTEGMNNVESAAAAGDNYNLRHILLADGIGAMVGSLLGSPFPPAVYIGHPGWKAVGGRIGYSLATGVVIALVCFLGLTALLLAVVPLVAILPILLYIGLVIGAQAFQAMPAKHAPAVVLAMIPNIAAWGADSDRRRAGRRRNQRRRSSAWTS